ncbi:hypothetical protein TNCV_224041 [Trichonephila clavipes]|nr:hypothetical protein TNCV_224041 [Trichonephila clavipes]
MITLPSIQPESSSQSCQKTSKIPHPDEARWSYLQLFSELSRLADHNYNLTLTTMASNNDLPTDMDFQNATLTKTGNSTPERLSGPTPRAKLEATKADIRRYTLIVQGFENRITSLRYSNTQDEHDPTFVEMVKQGSMYEDLLEKAVSEFGKLPYCGTPTSQRKPGCFPSSRTLTFPGTISLYDMGWRLASRAICPATDEAR